MIQNNLDQRYGELILSLKEKDYRLTPQRIELVKMIAASQGHPSAAEIHARIKIRFPTMSPATVYKTLALLKEMNQVLEIDLHGDSHYDGNRPDPHPHLVCTKCGRILDGAYELDSAVISKLEQTSGFQIKSSQINFYGFCPECK
jgi:Fur family transcriptional regulator, peroxide stress response regulator